MGISWEATLHKLRKKHQEAYDEMSEQIDALHKMKTRTERDIMAVEMEIHETKTGYEKAINDVTLGEKNLKNLKDKLSKLLKNIESAEDKQKCLDEYNKNILIENGKKLEEVKILLHRKCGIETENNSLSSLLDVAKHECETVEQER